MLEIVIADTSSLILLSKIGEIELLHACYSTVNITRQIANEFGESLPDWIKVHEVSKKSIQKTLEQLVDTGEASAIAYAFENPDCTIILDDRLARRLAKSLGFKVTGTLGVIVKAKKLGLIVSVKPILAKIAETDFRITPELVSKILDLTGEK
jgi:predicted nucleic acid-binding protein